MAVNEFDDSVVQMKVDTHSIMGTIKYPLPGTAFMDMFGFTREHLTRNLLALSLSPLGLLTLAYCVVLFAHREKR